MGHITWSVGGGKLPYGIMLSPAGMLVGSPGEEGRVHLQDHGPRTVIRPARVLRKSRLRGRSDRHRPDSLPVKYVIDDGQGGVEKTERKIDGKLDEPFWNLDQRDREEGPRERRRRGLFSAVWTANYHRYGGDRPGWYQLGELQGYNVFAAMRPGSGRQGSDGPKGKTPKDGIHIFIDGNHNKSLIYSGDDSHFFIPRNHKGGWAQSLRGKVNWFTDARVQEIEGGYTMEIRLGGATTLAARELAPLRRQGRLWFRRGRGRGRRQRNFPAGLARRCQRRRRHQSLRHDRVDRPAGGEPK